MISEEIEVVRQQVQISIRSSLHRSLLANAQRRFHIKGMVLQLWKSSLSVRGRVTSPSRNGRTRNDVIGITQLTDIHASDPCTDEGIPKDKNDTTEDHSG